MIINNMKKYIIKAMILLAFVSFILISIYFFDIFCAFLTGLLGVFIEIFPTVHCDSNGPDYKELDIATEDQSGPSIKSSSSLNNEASSTIAANDSAQTNDSDSNPQNDTSLIRNDAMEDLGLLFEEAIKEQEISEALRSNEDVGHTNNPTLNRFFLDDEDISNDEDSSNDENSSNDEDL